MVRGLSLGIVRAGLFCYRYDDVDELLRSAYRWRFFAETLAWDDARERVLTHAAFDRRTPSLPMVFVGDRTARLGRVHATAGDIQGALERDADVIFTLVFDPVPSGRCRVFVLLAKS